MSKAINQATLQSLATELAENLKTEKDLSALSRELVKLTVETALGKRDGRTSGLCKTLT